ncbi:RNA polymerase sigma factor [Mesorhizobium sp. IMUNJ 23232]|uniref:RNA polymerase sigma factor n=1 Tax=Mesorhizobium sp. IMUNJ 23232 TaxID=3376064 RepID=UPI0037921AC1
MASTEAASQPARAAIEKIAREEWGRLLSYLIRGLRDFQLAEDCLQDALASAMVHWQRNGLPASPAGWLIQTARRKAIDRIRRDANFKAKQTEYAILLELDAERPESEPDAIPDERLRLIFTCCHPALDEKTRLALTLRTLGGLTTEEIARCFLDRKEAMAQRLVRAREKIKRAGIPYEVPDKTAWPERLQSVLGVVYLIFNEGYAASSGESQVRVDLCDEAIRLARVLLSLKPGEPEIEGLLALMLLNHSRRMARHADGEGLVPLEQQDRSRWDRHAIREGLSLVDTALRRGRPGPYQLQAAISAIHAEASSHSTTGWQEIILIYDRLYRMTPNPVVRLNQAVAVSFGEGPEAAMPMLAALAEPLAAYQPFHAARADMLRRMGAHEEARAAYREAIRLSDHPRERAFLEKRMIDLPAPIRPAG